MKIAHSVFGVGNFFVLFVVRGALGGGLIGRIGQIGWIGRIGLIGVISGWVWLWIFGVVCCLRVA